MSEAVNSAAIAAFSGLLGVLAGAVISGYVTLEIAEIQFKQSQLTTAAESALNVRAQLAEKAAVFFLANQSFLDEFMAEDIDLEKLRASGESLSKARADLIPYLDGDLLIACDQMAESVRDLLQSDAERRSLALEEYQSSYKQFNKLYLRLRRTLEAHAQLDLLDSQLSDGLHSPP